MYTDYESIIEGDPKLGIHDIIPQAKVEQFIMASSALVDAYLECIYQVPFSPVPELVADITRELATSRCYSFLSVRSDTNRSEQAEEMRKMAEGRLEKLRGERVDPQQPFQPQLFIPGAKLRTGIIRTETDSLIYLPSQGTGKTMWSNRMNRPPDSREIESGRWNL